MQLFLAKTGFTRKPICAEFFLLSILSHFTDGQKKRYNRSNNSKIYKAELWFLCITHCLIVLYNCMKFYLYSSNGCQLTEWTRNSVANDQREVTPKLSEAELWLLCMTHRLIVRYNCMKFHLNSFNCCQLKERT